MSVEANIFKLENSCLQNEAVESKLIYGTRVNEPLVSIMIPTYNRTEYLIKSIESVIKQKTDIRFEVVVVDNSEESDEKFLIWLKQKSYECVSYYKNGENIGMFGNWNRCLKLAGAPWLLILNDDDEIAPDYINEMYKIVRKHPTASIVGCFSQFIDENGELLGIQEKNVLDDKKCLFEVKLKDMYYRNFLPVAGALLNKDCALKIGGFNPAYYPYSDFVFVVQLASLRKKMYINNQKLFRYRVAVNESMSLDTIKEFAKSTWISCSSFEKEYNVLPKAMAKWHKDCSILNYEISLKSQWGKSDLEELQRSFNDLNDRLGVKSKNQISLFLHENLMRVIVIKNKIFRIRK